MQGLRLHCLRSKGVVVSDYYYKRKQLLQPSIIAKQERLIVLHVGQFLLPLSLAFWATKRSNNRSAVAIRATERRSLRLASLLRNRSGSNDGHTLTLNRARNAAFRQEYSRNKRANKTVTHFFLFKSLNTNRRFARNDAQCSLSIGS